MKKEGLERALLLEKKLIEACADAVMLEAHVVGHGEGGDAEHHNTVVDERELFARDGKSGRRPHIVFGKARTVLIFHGVASFVVDECAGEFKEFVVEGAHPEHGFGEKSPFF